MNNFKKEMWNEILGAKQLKRIEEKEVLVCYTTTKLQTGTHTNAHIKNYYYYLLLFHLYKYILKIAEFCKKYFIFFGICIYRNIYKYVCVCLFVIRPQNTNRHTHKYTHSRIIIIIIIIIYYIIKNI